MLSPLAQQVAIRLYYGGSVTKAQLGSIAGTNETVRAAVEELTDIHIVFKERDKYCVHGAFANAFAELLAAPVTNDAQSSDHKAKNALSNDEELLKYARMQWDTVRFHALRNSDAVDRRFVQSDSVEMSGKLLDAFESANLVVKKAHISLILFMKSISLTFIREPIIKALTLRRTPGIASCSRKHALSSGSYSTPCAMTRTCASRYCGSCCS